MSRRQFTLDEKIGIIGRLKNGEKNSVIAKEFGTSSSPISTVWKNRDPLKNMAVLQPMDQNVIKNIKARNQLVLKMIEDIENHVESKTTVLDAIIMLDKAWCHVTSTGIANRFRHAGFCNVSTDTTQLQADSVLINDIDEDYVQTDDDLITSEIQTDEDIVNNVS